MRLVFRGERFPHHETHSASQKDSTISEGSEAEEGSPRMEARLDSRPFRTIRSSARSSLPRLRSLSPVSCRWVSLKAHRGSPFREASEGDQVLRLRDGSSLHDTSSRVSRPGSDRRCSQAGPYCEVEAVVFQRCCMVRWTRTQEELLLNCDAHTQNRGRRFSSGPKLFCLIFRSETAASVSKISAFRASG